MNITARDRLRLLGGASAALLGACGGGGGGGGTSAGQTAGTPVVPVTPTPPTPPTPAQTFVPAQGALRNAYLNDFKVGAAIQAAWIDEAGTDIDALKSQFNSISAEYEMKPDIIAPTEGVYDFTAADKIVDFAIANNMDIRGHTLLWHRTTPDYFLTGTKAEMKAKLEAYITAVLTHFKGRVTTWDVVNEVITDNGSEAQSPYRNSNWYQAVGSAEYIDWAFNAARAADPDVKLYINDYGTESTGKRNRLITVIDDLVARNIPLDGVGHQAHINVNTAASNVLQAVDAIDARFAGLENHITELDVSVYNDPGSCFNNQTGCAADYGTAIPASVIAAQAQLYRDVFTGLATRSSVTSVTLWGISDDRTWLNGYPVDRTNAPLLFDRSRAAKTAFRAVTDPTFEI